MRILVAGASGVLGRSTLPHLRDHEVVGLTRSAEGSRAVRDLGAEAVVCDVYEKSALLAAVNRTAPETVVNFLTDLSSGPGAANDRIRRDGAANLFAAAVGANASRLVVESVAFELEGDAGRAVEELERSTLAFPGEAVVLRFGRFWGPETFRETPAAPPSIHIDQAGAAAARLITSAPPGTHVVSE